MRANKLSRHVPRFESLESRKLLATLTVNVLSDGSLEELAGDGNLSLREAILAIDTGEVVDGVAPTSGEFGVDDRIEFHPDLFMTPQPDTPTISLSGGEFELSRSVDIVGPGREFLTIDADRSSRIFNFNTDTEDFDEFGMTPVEVSGLTLVNGFVEGTNPEPNSDPTNWGGAIFASRGNTLTLRDVAVLDSEVRLAKGLQPSGQGFVTGGGGVAVMWRGEIFDSEIAGNVAAGTGMGGGVFGVVTLTRSTLRDNVADEGGGGWDTGTIVESTISGNRASSLGGGIYSSNVPNISSSLFEDNIANRGGALRALDASDRIIRDSRFLNNEAEFAGGAIDVTDDSTEAVLSLENVTISDNIAQIASGIAFVGDRLKIQGSTVSNNRGDASVTVAGGDFSQGSLVIEDSLISGNETEASGVVTISVGADPIDGSSSGLRMSNTTITGNVGTGIKSFSSPITIESSTIANNRSAEGSAVGVHLQTLDDAQPTYEIKNSLIASNATADVFFEECSTDPDTLEEICDAGDTTTNDVDISHTLIGSVLADNVLQPTGESPDGNGNLIGSADQPIDPLIAPLADNGGQTATHALYVGSPAIDAGTEQSDLSFDQRGEPFARVFGDRVDMGAHEQTRLQLPGDLDLDGDVDTADRNVMNQFWTGALMPDSIDAEDRRTLFQGDLDGDGDVDSADATIMSANWTGARLGPMQLRAATDLAFREI